MPSGGVAARHGDWAARRWLRSSARSPKPAWRSRRRSAAYCSATTRRSSRSPGSRATRVAIGGAAAGGRAWPGAGLRPRPRRPGEGASADRRAARGRPDRGRQVDEVPPPVRRLAGPAADRPARGARDRRGSLAIGESVRSPRRVRAERRSWRAHPLGLRRTRAARVGAGLLDRAGQGFEAALEAAPEATRKPQAKHAERSAVGRPAGARPHAGDSLHDGLVGARGARLGEQALERQPAAFRDHHGRSGIGRDERQGAVGQRRCPARRACRGRRPA